MSAPVAVIPSRYAAQRFPGKPLALISGKPMIQHVVERCLEAKCFSRVVVATDDERISAAVRTFGGEAMMTSPDCASGTDRVAEVAAGLGLSAESVVINVQGDEPAVHPEALALLAGAFSDSAVEMATLVRALKDEERGNPNVVKAVLDEAHNALYFSRADLPFQRDPGGVAIQRWGHVGLYGYRARVLGRLATLPPTALERTESLEQLRALGHGIRIACRVTPHEGQAVDRPEDVPLAEAALARLAW
ncbi:MAG: 3-deoxy-manno-octulosonate cytidylyltransferase [Archangium sp.]|nr:3-deoxy-manno-octulosonate cytidylyltransferase [Archangium sp.]